MEVLKIRNQVTGEWEEITAIKGADGHTPARGVDYYTEADKQEMVQLVLAALPTLEGVEF